MSLKSIINYVQIKKFYLILKKYIIKEEKRKRKGSWVVRDRIDEPQIKKFSHTKKIYIIKEEKRKRKGSWVVVEPKILPMPAQVSSTRARQRTRYSHNTICIYYLFTCNIC
jgi:hypothetical protein